MLRSIDIELKKDLTTWWRQVEHEEEVRWIITINIWAGLRRNWEHTWVSLDCHAVSVLLTVVGVDRQIVCL